MPKIVEIDRWESKIRIAPKLMEYFDRSFPWTFHGERKVVERKDASGGTFYDPLIEPSQYGIKRRK